jgi:hypothetical protein
MLKTITGEGIWQVHEQNLTIWNPYIAHQLEVEETWKAEYSVATDIADADLEIKDPSQAKSIINRMMQMIAIRSKIRHEVARYSNSQEEEAIADKLERFCGAYRNELFKRTQKDVFRRSAWGFLMRGRVGMHTLYQPYAKDPKIRVKMYDGLTYFPVYGDDGMEFFTRERWMYRWELAAFFQTLSDKEVESIDLPDWARLDPKEFETTELLKVIEYWDADKMGWTVEEDLVQQVDLNYGMLTLREARLNDTASDEPRWESESFLGAIVNSLKMDASLASKLANALETYFYPYVVFKSKEGRLMAYPSNQIPLGGVPVDSDFDIKVINAVSNIEELKEMRNILKEDIDKSTISDVGWNQTGGGDESGFRFNLALGKLEDSVSDTRDQLEKLFGAVMGDVLYMHKRFARKGGWEYTMMEPTGRHMVQHLTAEDIGEHQEVIVTIKPAMPENLVQAVTILNQLMQPDPATGIPSIPPEWRLKLSGLSDVIGDMTSFNDDMERYQLKALDEEVKQLNLASLRAKHYPELRDMEKRVTRLQRKQAKQEAARVQKEIEEGMTQDVVVPASIATDPVMMQQLASMIQGGAMPQDAVANLEQGLPLGVPGEPVAEGEMQPQPAQTAEAFPTQQTTGQIDPQTLSMMQEMGIQMPDSLTGYSNGIPPEVAPSPVQGGRPRQAVDRPNLEVEAINTNVRRGAKPAAK